MSGIFYKLEVGILSFHCCILIYGNVAQTVEHWLGARGTVMILFIMLLIVHSLVGPIGI